MKRNDDLSRLDFVHVPNAGSSPHDGPGYVIITGSFLKLGA